MPVSSKDPRTRRVEKAELLFDDMAVWSVRQVQLWTSVMTDDMLIALGAKADRPNVIDRRPGWRIILEACISELDRRDHVEPRLEIEQFLQRTLDDATR